MRSEKYDECFVLTNSFKSAIIPFIAKIKKRISYLGEFRYGLINIITQSNLEDISGDVSNDDYSLSVSGYFIPQESGTYTFTCEGDDGVFFLLNGSVVASHPGAHGKGSIGTHTGNISLTAGTKYTLNAYMQERGGGIGLRIFWKTPSNSTWTIHSNEISSD